MEFAISVLVSYVAVRGFRFVLTEQGLTLRNTESFIWLLIFFLFLGFCDRIRKSTDYKLKLCAGAFGGIIAAFYILGVSYEKQASIRWIWAGGIRSLINCLNMYFSYAFLFAGFAFFAYIFLRKYDERNPRISNDRFSLRKVLIVWGILLLFYIPWYLFFYPAVMTIDSGSQIQDALSLKTLSDANPAFVTLLIRAVLVPVTRLGGSVQTGVAVCSFLQMMVVTFVFALSYERICHYLKNKILHFLFLAWFAIYPVNNIYSITMWKDILFSACMLGFSLCIDAAAEDETVFFSKPRNCVLLLLTLLLMPLLRHNGIFITAGMAVYLPFRFKQYRRKAVIVGSGALILFCAWKFALLPVIRTSKPSSKEVLAVPLQQIARVLRDHHGDMSPWKLEEAESYFDIPEVWTTYWEKIVDPFKSHFDTKKYNSDRGKFFSLWADLGKKYPVDYLEAFLHNNYGYWFPETSWWITGIGVVFNNDVYGLHRTPVIKPAFLNNYYEWYHTAQYKKEPILPLFFKPGAIWWGWLFCAFYCLYNNRKKFILFLPAFMLWFSLLFSAVYCEFRYAYGLFVCLPLFLAASLSPRGRPAGDTQQVLSDEPSETPIIPDK